MSRIEIGSDAHRVTIDYDNATLTELVTAAQQAYTATWHEPKPEQSTEPAGSLGFSPVLERASSIEYITNQPTDL